MVISRVNSDFKLKELGSLNYSFGMDVQAVDDCLILGQQKYIMDMLLIFGLANALALPTPMSSKFLAKFAESEGESPSADAHLYRSIVGALNMYV